MKLEYLPGEEKIKITAEEKYEYLAVKKWFARRPDGYMFTPRFKMRLWDGYNHGFDKETDTINMGLWREVLKMCDEFGYPFNFVNKGEFPINRDVNKKAAIEWFKELLNSNEMGEREYQLRVAASVLKDRYCNISVATSGGKTFIFSLIIFYLLAHGHSDKKFLLVVPSKTLVTQFYDDLIKYNNGKFPINIREIYSEDSRITDPDSEPNIVIGTFQSLATYEKKWFRQFWSITADEGHKSGSESYRHILKSTFGSAYYRWGMSGSFPKDETEEMMQIMKHTGPVIETVKAKELQDAGYISKVKIKGIVLNHNDYEFLDRLELVAARDKKACYDLEVSKVQESEERLLIINKIVSQCTANTLVLFHNTEYGERMFELLKERNPDKVFHYIDGGVTNKKRTPIKEDMERTDKVRILVASFGTLSTGVSINAIQNVIFTQSFKKAQIIIQSIGRVLRLHKEKSMAYVFDIVDRFNPDPYVRGPKRSFKNVLWTHWEKRLAIYSEEEFPVGYVEIGLKG